MKQVIAFIQPRKLVAVVHALHQVQGLTGMSAGEVRGFGRTRRDGMGARMDEDLEILRPQVRVEVACRDELVEPVVDAIVSTAHSGLAGDGKIYVAELREALRIATLERGEEAV